MAVDYVPMISGTVGIRYGCRQKGCGLIPKYETHWFHCEATRGDEGLLVLPCVQR